MKKTLFILGTFLCLVTFSCVEKDDDDVPIITPEPIEDTIPAIYTQLDVVTGIDLFDDNGSSLGRWKSPNDKLGQSFVYPNPNIGEVSVHSTQNIKRVWLIPANCMLDTVSMDIPTLSQNLSYEVTALVTAQIKDITLESPNSNIRLNLSDVPSGFYKLFFQLASDEVFWQNIYTDPSASQPPSYEELDNVCN